MNPTFQQLSRLLKQFGFLRGLNEKGTELWLASEWFNLWLKQCRISPASQISKCFLKKVLVVFFFLNHSTEKLMNFEAVCCNVSVL